jgi:hypothetical protein
MVVGSDNVSVKLSVQETEGVSIMDTYMVVYRAKDLLRSYDQAHHLPDGHLKVHLRELEQALEETRHMKALVPRRRRAPECRRADRVVPWERDVRIHGV